MLATFNSFKGSRQAVTEDPEVVVFHTRSMGITPKTKSVTTKSSECLMVFQKKYVMHGIIKAVPENAQRSMSVGCVVRATKHQLASQRAKSNDYVSMSIVSQVLVK